MSTNPPHPGQPAAKPQSRLARYASIVFGVAILIIGVVKLIVVFYPTAKACDASEVQSAVISSLNESIAKTNPTARITALSQIATTGTDNALKQCTGVLTFNDNSTAPVVFTVTPKQVEARIQPTR